MNKPVLVVLAAGLGSRYGGMKQIDPVGPNNQLIIDYSIFDARRAGFETVVFIIKKEMEEAFKEAIGNRLSKIMDVKYAYQRLEDLPTGFTVPQGRTKPWGTSHAVLSAQHLLNGPFAVINADDYYGPEAFQVVYEYLFTCRDDQKYNYCMVGYLLQNTVTENGSVARGVCTANDDGTLASITERTCIEKMADGIKFTEDDGQTWTTLPGDTLVSMNLWGFNGSLLQEVRERFATYLTEHLPQNPLKCEYYLPIVVGQLLAEDKAQVKILESHDKWYGVTYKEDKPEVVEALAQKTAQGIYPKNLW